MSVTYRSTGQVKIAFSCDRREPLVATLPANPKGGTVECGRIAVPAGASVVRLVAISCDDAFEMLSLSFND
jgi:hypothetical protein